MRKTILLALLVLGSSGLFAQSKSKGSGSYSAGIGVHLGEPFAVTYKKYNGKTSWEASLGITRRSFGYSDNVYLNSLPRFEGYGITGYEFGICTSAQFHYLFNYEIKALDGMQIYWGLGPQIRFRPYSVNLSRWAFPSWTTTTKTGVDLDLGLDLVFGAEYKFKNLPLAVFADITPFTEFVDRFYVYPMGGVGGRFVF